jgi:rhomboid family GlyGly-CTERM serine protease
MAGRLLPHDMLEWQRSVVVSEPWRLWTAAWVHWSALHLLANLAGCLLVAALGVVARVAPSAVLAWCAAWPLAHGVLLWQAELQRYGGLSGVLHAGVAVAAWQLLRQDTGMRRWIGGALLAGLVAKVLGERPWAAALVRTPPWDFEVAPFAHAAGAAAGLLCAVVIQAVDRSTARGRAA